MFGRHTTTVGVGRDDQVSGEAVALALPPASIGLRILTGIIDIILGVGVWYALRWLAVQVLADADAALRLAVNTLCVVVALVVVPTASETLTRGKTLGHWILGLRTVRDDAGPIGFRHAIARALLGVVEIYGCLGLPAFLTAVISRKGKRLGDMLAGTYVIRDRRRLTVPEPIAMPRELAPWAQHADIAVLPAPLSIGIRQFFERREKMKPDVREALGQRLAWECGRYLAPPPPFAAPPEMLLAAVMAERRRRDTARLAHDDALRRRLLG